MEFTIKTSLPASPKTVYSAWLNSEEHSNMTGGDADISDEVGTKFTAWDGYIEGTNILLEPFKRIVQSWRTTEFEEGEQDSQIEILLVDQDGETELTLIHTKLSENGGHYEQGWINHYFKPMREYFSQ